MDAQWPRESWPPKLPEEKRVSPMEKRERRPVELRPKLPQSPAIKNSPPKDLVVDDPMDRVPNMPAAEQERVQKSVNSWIEKGWNLTRDMKHWIVHGLPLTSVEEYEQRRAYCNVCPTWNPGGNLGFGECNSKGCGCTRLKLYVKTSQCPEKKWPGQQQDVK